MGGDGHSRVYDDPEVYRLAIEFALLTTSLEPGEKGAGKEAEISAYAPPINGASVNPFTLPWAVRGMLEEARGKGEDVGEEVKELVREFDEWKPSSKILRDVRWRLEGVRGLV